MSLWEMRYEGGAKLYSITKSKAICVSSHGAGAAHRTGCIGLPPKISIKSLYIIMQKLS